MSPLPRDAREAVLLPAQEPVMIRQACDHTFTVFTPTYNRAHTLHRVYQSLRSQTFRDFEWLIVDDGSTDATEEVVRSWQHEAVFPIRYVHQQHSGKHVAFNRGVREAAGELFLSLDSDDACVPTALERFKYHWDAIPSQRRRHFSAVTALVQDERDQLVGDRFPHRVTDSDPLEQYFVHRVSGEKWGFQRTEILRDFPFPEPVGVSHVAEAVVWFAIARHFKTRYVNEVLRIYYHDPAARHRLSRLSRSTAQGRLLFHHAVLEEYRDYVRRSPALAAKSAINYSRYSFQCGIGVIDQLARLRTSTSRLLVCAFLPVGTALWLRDRSAIY